MMRAVEVQRIKEDDRAVWLATEIDDVETQIVSSVDKLTDRVDSFQKVLIGVLIAITTSAIMLAINLVVQASS